MPQVDPDNSEDNVHQFHRLVAPDVGYPAQLEPDDPTLPRIITVHTTCAADIGPWSTMIPHAVFRELDPINTTAASLYVAVVRAGKHRTRVLDLVRDVFWRLAWFHDWSDNKEALAEVLVAADLLEEHGWMLRERGDAGTELWTPLGRDTARISPAGSPDSDAPTTESGVA